MFDQSLETNFSYFNQNDNKINSYQNYCIWFAAAFTFTLINEIFKNSLIFVGIPIRSTLDNSTTVQYAGLISQLAAKARSTVRDIDPSNDLTFLRIRSKKHEIMVAPG